MNAKNVADFYPLSPMQQGMLFHSLYAPDSGVYVEQLSCTLDGDLNVRAFERAWQRVVERHTILRTGFVGESLKEPAQVVKREAKVVVTQHDWRSLPPAEQSAQLAVLLQTDRTRAFDLAAAPLMRLTLIRVAAQTYEFVWSYHHALLDGWSTPLLIQEVLMFYDAAQRGEELRLPPVRPYRDYITWLKQQSLSDAEAYWRHTLKGFTTPTPLVVDRLTERSGEDNTPTNEIEVRLSAATTAVLQSLARQQHLTLSTIVQGAWALLLSRYSGEDDVLFGATVSGRPVDLPDAETMIGLFINTLPVRVQISADISTIDWLKSLQAQLVELRQYEYSPLVQIQSWSEVPRGQPLFESLLVFENYPVAAALQQHDGSLHLQNVQSVEQTNYPLNLVAGADHELLLRLLYDENRFERATIERMLGHLATILESFALHPTQPLHDVPLLTKAERHQLLIEWNNTAADYPHDQCAHELFEGQVTRTPEAIAVTHEAEAVTYRELNRRTNQVAHRLRKSGVGPEQVVGIYVERSIDMLVGVLSVLKAGGAYLPIDPAYPPERIAFLLEDAGVSIVLTQHPLLLGFLNQQLEVSNQQFICLDTDWPSIAQESDEDPINVTTPDNLAYIIYTSGSTGKPKGTLLQHRGLCNFITAYIKAFDINPDSRVLQFFSFGFDGSVADIFSALLSGATLCLASRETLLSTPDLHALLKTQRITTALMPPSALTLLPSDDLPDLCTLITGGDSCPPELAARWSQSRSFFNAYGPTEATVAVSWYRVVDQNEAIIPIGKPIANTQHYVLDKHLRPVPIGVPGELHVGGVDLARGYLNRPELTAEKFIANPFKSEIQNQKSKIYKTGDLVRYRADGNIEFLGRIDQQVKIRGFRVELGEIESLVRQQPGVRECAVLAREDTPNEKRLVAYLVPNGQLSSEAEFISMLRTALKDKLPAYMIPAAFVMMEALPLTTHGKLDRKALPAPDRERAETDRVYVAPRDIWEFHLVRLWEELLDVHPISVTDNFFELGGHSLIAVRLMARIQQQLNRPIPLVQLFQEPTIEHLAHILREGIADAATVVPLRPFGKKRPLFMVHPSGGSVHWYYDLARRLGDDQPLYGLQAQGLNGDRDLHTRIDEMAAHYVTAMREVQPNGPYQIGGWSLGVIIAFEIARQLEQQGQAVSLLALLDQGPILPLPKPIDDADYLVNTFGQNISLSIEKLRELNAADQIAYVWEKARKAKWLYPDVTLEQFRLFVTILRTHTEAWRNYEVGSFAGHVTLFRAEKPTEHTPREPDFGWSTYALGGVTIVDVPGDHLGMMHEPHVAALADRLQTCLNAAAQPIGAA
ncbi:MAG: amino acid adenylation domain-containing protein [Anaerolineae bacterium]